MAEGRSTVLGQESWLLANDQVELAVSVTGGQMAPVSFFRGTPERVQPYYLNHWPGAKTGLPLLDVLRGDFFCLPFGQGHPPHGETANADWSFVGRQTEGDRASLALSLRPKARRGTVRKTIWLLAGHNALYIRHELSGFSGRMCYSHILEVPEQVDELLPVGDGGSAG
ncbi:MAG: hypothetical protein A2V99_18470 [Spirochaetes bacterium RBG_16_67_19]|nr:MAG: hypothetical protein A2V99_18470 [Spirochaetes bacterium RBG_16_67_19]